MLCGLPGTGKSTLARELGRRLPAVVVESDRIRQKLFAPPSYSPEESRRVHRVCHILMGWYARHYYHVIYDATNLYEHHRAAVYRLAERSGARLAVVQVAAGDQVVRSCPPNPNAPMLTFNSSIRWPGEEPVTSPAHGGQIAGICGVWLDFLP